MLKFFPVFFCDKISTPVKSKSETDSIFSADEIPMKFSAGKGEMRMEFFSPVFWMPVVPQGFIPPGQFVQSKLTELTSESAHIPEKINPEIMAVLS